MSIEPAPTPTVVIDAAPARPEDLGREVRESLSGSPRELSPKLLYDERGSELFDAITNVPEYYPTRCERAILNRRAPDLVAGMLELVELGSGTASKTRALLYAMAGTGTLERYVPFDVDESIVRASAAELAEYYPGLAVHGVVGDFESDLGRIPAGERRLFALLGGTIGNLHPAARARFLAGIRAVMGDGDRLILGTDLIKDRATLEAAYDDAQGVTAAFNLGALRVLNDRLGANFDPARFAHRAPFDEDESRIEMRLRSLGAQHVSIPGADLELDLADGEEIRTEISTKFTAEQVAAELEAAGLRREAFYTDEDGMFGLSSARPA